MERNWTTKRVEGLAHLLLIISGRWTSAASVTSTASHCAAADACMSTLSSVSVIFIVQRWIPVVVAAVAGSIPPVPSLTTAVKWSRIRWLRHRWARPHTRYLVFCRICERKSRNDNQSRCKDHWLLFVITIHAFSKKSWNPNQAWIVCRKRFGSDLAKILPGNPQARVSYKDVHVSLFFYL